LLWGADFQRMQRRQLKIGDAPGQTLARRVQQFAAG
jgi:hypothetical protein